MNTCTNCGFQEEPTKFHSGWWSFANYFGICGFFCRACSKKVSHDSYGKPKHLEQYEEIWKKQNGDKT